jgi:septum site-determining protein MinD
MLAIAGGKGGSGKTTTALGLAAAVDGPALAVDADCDMPDLHSLAGVAREPTLSAVADAPRTTAATAPDLPSVSVLPAPRDETDTVAALSRVAAADVPAVVDCPAGAGPDAVRPLRVADAAVLATPLCGPALRDAAKTAAMARAVGTDVAGAVLTRATATPDAVADLLDCPVLAAVPPVDAPVLGAPRVRAAYDRVLDLLRDRWPDAG